MYGLQAIKMEELIFLHFFRFNDTVSNTFHDFINEKIVLTENLIIQYNSLIDEMKSYLALSPLEKKEVKNMEYEVNISLFS